MRTNTKYFLNFDEGDNITITSDFLENAQILYDTISTLETLLNKTKRELNENITILQDIIKILIKESDK